jgi:hypothetical protein
MFTGADERLQNCMGVPDADAIACGALTYNSTVTSAKSSHLMRAIS